jgi:hypothetical protein
LGAQAEEAETEVDEGNVMTADAVLLGVVFGVAEGM